MTQWSDNNFGADNSSRGVSKPVEKVALTNQELDQLKFSYATSSYMPPYTETELKLLCPGLYGPVVQ